MDITFVVNSVLLGIGLAMDAFSVSLANGLSGAGQKRGRMVEMSAVFAFFQFAMPMIGWICVKTVAELLTGFEVFIPWIALALLGFIGSKMLIEGIKGGEQESGGKDIRLGTLLLQGIATSIDALSVGFTIAKYDVAMALSAGAIIAAITFALCLGGAAIGRRFGTKLSGRAGILGGSILIFIGIEIFVTGIF